VVLHVLIYQHCCGRGDTTYGGMLADVHGSTVGSDERVDLGYSVSWLLRVGLAQLTKLFNTAVEGTVGSASFMPV
jgi:hypothetical protein